MKKTIRLLAAAIAIGISGGNTMAQCPAVPNPDVCGTCASIFLPPTIFGCYPIPIPISPSVTVPPYMTVNSWSFSSGSSVWASGSGPGVPPFLVFPWNFGAVPPCGLLNYPATLTVNAYGPDLIYNSNFLAGATGFCSQATIIPTSTTLSGPPEVTVVNSANLGTLSSMALPYYWTCAPFNAMPGSNMLFCDLDPNVDVIWQQDVMNLCNGESYDIGYFQANLWGDCSGTIPSYAPVNTYLWIQPNVGPIVGPFTGGGGTSWNSWGTQNLTTWVNSGGATSATIYITAAPMPPPFIFSYIPWGYLLALDNITMNRSCTVNASTLVTVDYNSITGPKTCCVGQTIALVSCTSGGSWISTVPFVGTVDPFGNFTGLNPGVTTVIYTDIYGCSSSITISVNPTPVITGGPNNICVGGTIALSATPPGGSWSWDPIVNLTGPGPVFTGITAGTGNITYTLPTGCYALFPCTVNPNPDPMDDMFMCIGDVQTVIDNPPGGFWTSSNPLVASITYTGGVITALTVGVTTITYTTLAGCTTTFNVYVVQCAGGSGGYLCMGSSTTLIGSPSGGTWTSSDPTIAPITPGGVVTTIPGSITVPTIVTFYYTVGGSVVMTVTILIQPPVTACVKTIIIGGPSYYAFDFTSTCSGGPCFIKYDVYDYLGNQLPCIAGTGCTDWTVPGIIPYTTIAGWYGGAAYTVCVDSVWCNGCWWPADCCAKVNPGPKSSHGVNNGAPAMEYPLKIVPNPNNGTFTIAGDIPNSITSNDAKIEIVNMLGQVVYADVASVDEGTVSKIITLGSNIANGIYLLRIKAVDGSQVIRFTIDR